MVTNNFAIYGLKVAYDLASDIVFFPLWWYTGGLKKIVLAAFRFLKNREKALALFVWTKNIFTPMYGQRDFAGAAISFVMRLVQIVFRGLAMFFWLAVAIALVLFWLILPFFVIGELIFQIL